MIALPSTRPGSPSTRTEAWSRRTRRLAAGRVGLVVVFLWAFAEAFMWPLIPDSALMALAFAAPFAIWRLWIWCAAGSITGGAVGLLLGRAGAAWPLPLVTGRMKETVAGWMTEGAGALLHQPFSGVPYKVFVAQSGSADIGVVDWAMWTALARGGRMLAFGMIGAAAGWVLWNVVPERLRARAHLWTYLTGAVLLFSGLAFVVVSWM